MTYASSTSIAQAIAIAAAPILTRLYPPEVFGASALFISITGIVNVVSCLRYEQAIVLPEKDSDAASLFYLAIVFNLIVTAIFSVVVLAFHRPLLAVMKAEDLEPYLWLLIAAVHLGGLSMALNYWNTRTRQYSNLSYSRVSGAIVNSGGQIAGGMWGHATISTRLISQTAGVALSTLVMGLRILKADREVLGKRWSLKGMWIQARRYRKFPLINTWSSLLNALSWQLPTLLLAVYFSPSIVGYYALGYQVLRIPMNFIGQAIGQVFFQRAAEAKNRGTITPLVRDSYQRLVSVGLFPFLLLTLVGSEAFRFLFGPSWTEAGVFSQILGLWSFFWFISSPISTLYSVLERQEELLVFNVLLLISRFLSIAAGGWLHDARVALGFFSVTGTLMYGYLSLAIMKKAGITIRWSLLVILKRIALFIPLALPIVLLKIFYRSDLFILIASGIASIAYYALILRGKFAISREQTP